MVRRDRGNARETIGGGTMPITKDERINFKMVHLDSHSGQVVIKVEGGPMARVQIAVLNENGQIVNGVGVPGFGEPLVTDGPNGTATWPFPRDPKATHI